MLVLENDSTGRVIELYRKRREMYIRYTIPPPPAKDEPTGPGYDAVYLAGAIIRSPRTKEG